MDGVKVANFEARVVGVRWLLGGKWVATVKQKNSPARNHGKSMGKL